MHGHLVGEQLLFEAHNVYARELESFCRVDGHQAHAVVVVRIILVRIGQQGHIDQEFRQGPGLLPHLDVVAVAAEMEEDPPLRPQYAVIITVNVLEAQAGGFGRLVQQIRQEIWYTE